jgi:toxin CcdB
MAQFDVHHNVNPATRAAFPYLVDVQSGLFDDLATRVVVPVARLDAGKLHLRRLTPVIDIAGEPCVLMTPQLAGVRRDALGGLVTRLVDDRDAIIGALDFLMTGS